MNEGPADGWDQPLEGRAVRLEPLGFEHVDALAAAAFCGDGSGEPRGERASFALTHVPATRAQMHAYVATALALRDRGLAVPYATRRLADETIVGSTRFANLEYWVWPEGHEQPRPEGHPDAVEIGWTWLTLGAQRSVVNTEAKRLMLAFAFERWRVHRVMLKTDARNLVSRANIERIGGRLDGILRAHVPAADGGIRDTAWYSILPAEWPAIAARLDARLTR